MAIAKNSHKKNPKKKEGIFKQALSLSWDQFSSTTSIHGFKITTFVWLCKLKNSFRSQARQRPERQSFHSSVLVDRSNFLLRLRKCSNGHVSHALQVKSNADQRGYKLWADKWNWISSCDFLQSKFHHGFSSVGLDFFLVSRLRHKFKNSTDSILLFSETYPESENVSREDLATRIKYTAGFTNPIGPVDSTKLPYLQDILSDNRFDVQTTMKKLMYPCTKLLWRCRWEGVILDCKEIFRIAETYQGYCCAFNILKPTGASVASNIQKIRKTQYFGPDMGLSVIINPLIEHNAMTSVNSEGIKILVNEHNLYPSERTIERMLPHQQETFVEVRPERTDCSNAVRSLPLSDRGCVFNNEHALK